MRPSEMVSYRGQNSLGLKQDNAVQGDTVTVSDRTKSAISNRKPSDSFDK